LQKNINSEIPKTERWLTLNRQSLNVNKTNYLFFSKIKKKIYVKWQEKILEHVDCMKCLRVYFDDHLKWNNI